MLGAIVLEHNGITWKGATVINATTWRCENGSFSGRPPMRSTCAEGRVAPAFQFRTIVMGVGILFQRRRSNSRIFGFRFAGNKAKSGSRARTAESVHFNVQLCSPSPGPFAFGDWSLLTAG